MMFTKLGVNIEPLEAIQMVLLISYNLQQNVMDSTQNCGAKTALVSGC
jgi:hypothetical protein